MIRGSLRGILFWGYHFELNGFWDFKSLSKLGHFPIGRALNIFEIMLIIQVTMLPFCLQSSVAFLAAFLFRPLVQYLSKRWSPKSGGSEVTGRARKSRTLVQAQACQQSASRGASAGQEAVLPQNVTLVSNALQAACRL